MTDFIRNITNSYNTLNIPEGMFDNISNRYDAQYIVKVLDEPPKYFDFLKVLFIDSNLRINRVRSFDNEQMKMLDLVNNLMAASLEGKFDCIMPLAERITLYPHRDLMVKIENSVLEHMNEFVVTFPKIAPAMLGMFRTGAGSSGIGEAIARGVYPSNGFEYLRTKEINPTEISKNFMGMLTPYTDPETSEMVINLIQCAGMPIAFSMMSEINTAMNSLDINMKVRQKVGELLYNKHVAHVTEADPIGEEIKRIFSR